MKKNKKIIFSSFLLANVLLLAACAEKTDKESLNDSYESILTEEEAKKYNKGKEDNLEKDMRISFLQNDEYRENFEKMIVLYHKDLSYLDKYTNDDEYKKNALKHLKEMKDSANYIEKFDTERVPNEELDLLYELKILAINIKSYIETSEHLLNGDKIITGSAYKSYSIEMEDKFNVIESQYLKSLNMFEEFLNKKHKSSLKDYVNKNIEFKEEK